VKRLLAIELELGDVEMALRRVALTRTRGDLSVDPLDRATVSPDSQGG
jgi:hypothetical protein